MKYDISTIISAFINYQDVYIKKPFVFTISNTIAWSMMYRDTTLKKYLLVNHINTNIFKDDIRSYIHLL